MRIYWTILAKDHCLKEYRMTDLDFIKKFSKITIRKACEKTQVNQGNLWNGKASGKSIELVKNSIVKELLMLFEEYYDVKQEEC